MKSLVFANLLAIAVCYQVYEEYSDGYNKVDSNDKYNGDQRNETGYVSTLKPSCDR